MDEGLSSDEAYKAALKDYSRRRKKDELAQRVAQEQFLESATVPNSIIIENVLKEEKEVLSAEFSKSNLTK